MWTIVLAVGFVAWILLAGKVTSSASGNTFVLGPNVSMEDLHSLEARVLALARDYSTLADKSLAQRIDALKEAVTQRDPSGKLNDLASQVTALDALIKQVESSLKETKTAAKLAGDEGSALRRRVDSLEKSGVQTLLEDASAQLVALKKRIETLETRPIVTTPSSTSTAAPALTRGEIEGLIADALKSVSSKIKGLEDRALGKDVVASMISSAVDPTLATREQVAGIVEKSLKPLRDNLATLESSVSKTPRSGEIAKKTEIEEMIARAVAVVRDDLSRYALKGHSHEDASHRPVSSGDFSAVDVEAIVRRMLEIERADVFGRMDFAKAIVANMTAPTWEDLTPLQKYWARILGVTALSPPGPESVIGMGARHSCGWPFQRGGSLTVELTQPVEVRQVTVEHLKKQISVHWEHAPKAFDVYLYGSAADLVNSTGVAAGSFEYDVNQAHAIQLFTLASTPSPKKSKYVRFHFSSAHGDSYICLHRVRVFGP